MYSSLKKWMNLDVCLKKCTGRNAAGTKLFGETIEYKCYVAGSVKTITDNSGAEVVSTTQIYFDGNVPIAESDRIIFEGKEDSIRHISTFYRNGKADIKVVYL